MENIFIISALSLLVIISPVITRIVKIPVAITEMMLGSLVAYFGFFDQSDTLFAVLAKVGFLFLMFLAGMEVNLREFAQMKSSFIKQSIIYFVILYGLSFIFVYLFDLSIVYIVALPIVSLGMIMALLHDYGKQYQWLNLALTVGIIGELLSIIALTILSGQVQFGFGKEFLFAMITLVVFMVVVVLFFNAFRVLFWWFPHTKRIIMPDDNAQDLDVRVSMALFFVMIGLMLYLDLEVVLGAFVAGMFITSFFDHKAELPAKLSSFGFGFLVPIFFIFVGSTFDLVLITNLYVVAVSTMIVAMMLIIRFVATKVAFGKLLGADYSLFALTNSMPLTFLVAVATIGLNGNMLSIEEYSAFILASMVEAIFIMIYIKATTR